MPEPDYYEILRIRRNATLEEIKRAYRRSVRLYHPDVTRNARFGDDRFKAIQRAYEALTRNGKSAGEPHPQPRETATPQAQPRPEPRDSWTHFTTIPAGQGHLYHAVKSEELMSSLCGDSNDAERCRSAEVLAGRGELPATIAILKRLREGDKAIAPGAAVGFGVSRCERAVYALVQMVGQRNRTTADAARWALKQLPAELVHSVVEAELRKASFFGRIRYRRLLASLKPE